MQDALAAANSLRPPHLHVLHSIFLFHPRLALVRPRPRLRVGVFSSVPSFLSFDCFFRLQSSPRNVPHQTPNDLCGVLKMDP